MASRSKAAQPASARTPATASVAAKSAAVAPKAEPPTAPLSSSVTPQAEVEQTVDDSELNWLNWSNTSALEAVARSLQQLGAQMLSELESNFESLSHTFLSFSDGREDDSVAQLTTIIKSFTQYSEFANTADAKGSAATYEESLPCSCTAWSCDSEALAIGYGQTQHNGWCRHRSGVVVTFPLKDSPTSCPSDCTIPTSSCVHSVAFHPARPHVLAAGLSTGQVLVWELRGVDSANSESVVSAELLCKSRCDDSLHREPVIGLSWLWQEGAQEHLLLSVSQEGKGHAWMLQNSMECPVTSFILTAGGHARLIALGAVGAAGGRRKGGGGTDSDEEDLLPSQRRAAAAQVNKDAQTGASSFAASSLEAGTLIVGGDTGSVLQCKLLVSSPAVAAALAPLGSLQRRTVAAGAIAKADNTLPWEAVAVDCLQRIPDVDRARVCRAVERLARDLSLATVTMGVLYQARASTESLLFHSVTRFGHNPHAGPVKSVACSPFHRNLYASAGADGRLCVWYGLLAAPLLTLEPSHGSSGSNSLSAVIWSTSRPTVLAAASMDGKVYVYDLWQSTAHPVLCLSPSTGTPSVQASATPAGQQGSGALSDGAALTLAFNPEHKRVLCVGYASGACRVWQLPSSVCTPGHGYGTEGEVLCLKTWVQGAMDSEGGLHRSATHGEAAVRPASLVDEDSQRPNAIHHLRTEGSA